jgi:hypothetical protein
MGGYWDEFTVCNSGDNANHGSGGSQGWVDYQWGCMAGGGIKTDASGRVVKDVSGKVEVIYDLSGKAVFNVNVKTGTNRINTSALTKGVYILKYGLNTVKVMR